MPTNDILSANTQERIMTQHTTKTSDIEYCETCGTMLLMGECRRCNPTTKATRPKNISAPKSQIHAIGVGYVVENLIDHEISTRLSNDRGIDLVLDNNKTVLVRAMSSDGRLALTNGTLDYLKADYLIIVSNLNTRTQRNIQIMSMDEAKNISINNQYRASGRNDYFINRSEYVQYKDNYIILEN